MANIVLKDINGNEATYSRDKIMVDTAEGGTQIFSEGEAVENVPISLYLANGDQTITAPDGTLVKSAVILKPENLKPENIAKDVEIAGVVGKFEGGVGEEVTVTLNMANGDQVIVPTEDGKTLSKVTVIKPGTLIPENIKKGVSIGGVSGEYALDNMPQLYPPTAISFTTSTTGYLTVTNPTAKNGVFPSKVQILVLPSGQTDYVVAAEAEMSTASAVASVTIKGAAFSRSIALSQPIARFCADGFQSSEAFKSTSVIYSVFGLLYDLVGISLNNTDKFAFSVDTKTYNLTAQESYYLPKTAEVIAVGFDGESLTPEYTYDPDTGTLVLVGRMADTVTIKAHAVQIPWLRNPVLPIDNMLMLTVEKIDENATETKVFIDGEHALSVADEREGMLSWAFKSVAAKQTSQVFTLQSSGYYRATCAAGSSYSVARVDFDMVTEAEVEIQVKRYLGNSTASYLNTHFGMVSIIDTELASSTADDGTSKVAYYCGKNYASQTYTNTIKITIPAGKHFLYFKYRHPTTSSSGYFEFKINTTCAENTKYDITEFFPTYGDYNVQAQSYADGYTESDLVSLGYSYKPVIKVTNDILSVVNLVPSGVTGFEVYIDGELKDTLAYDSTTGLSVDLTTYGASTDAGYTVHVAGVGDGVPANQSDAVSVVAPYYSVNAVSGASYGFTLNSSTGYYVSGNKGVNSSAAVCKVIFNTQGKHLYLDCINYAEANYDFGILSNIDSTLDTTNTADTTYFKSFKGSISASVQTVDYGVVAAGEHFIYVKFRKDGSGNSNNDTLQFKVRFA